MEQIVPLLFVLYIAASVATAVLKRRTTPPPRRGPAPPGGPARRARGGTRPETEPREASYPALDPLEELERRFEELFGGAPRAPEASERRRSEAPATTLEGEVASPGAPVKPRPEWASYPAGSLEGIDAPGDVSRPDMDGARAWTPGEAHAAPSGETYGESTGVRTGAGAGDRLGSAPGEPPGEGAGEAPGSGRKRSGTWSRGERAAAAEGSGIRGLLRPNSLAQAILLSEVLGPPRALRPYRPPTIGPERR